MSDEMPPRSITMDEKARRDRHQLCTDTNDERVKRGDAEGRHSGETTANTPVRIESLGAE